MTKEISTVVVFAFWYAAATAQPADSNATQKDSAMVAAQPEGKDTVYVLRGDADEDEKSQIREQIEAIKDTVLVLTREGTDDLLSDFREQRRNARQRGFGGALGVSPGLYGVHMKPADELIRNDASLRSIGFNIGDTYEMFVMMGGMGYAGLGNGVRIGGGGRGGSREFARTRNDTTYTVDIGVGFGGFLVEKARVAKDFNFFLGAMLGGGGMSFDFRSTYGSPFIGTLSDTNTVVPGGEAHASFLLLEAHGGITYSFLSWLHIGADISAPFFISASGFKAGNQGGITDGFVTVNPGVRLRIMFGNLG